MEIAGKKFVITGGNRGIGLAVAEMASSMGAHIIIVARSCDVKLQERLRALGAKSVQCFQTDLSNRVETEALALKLRELDIDILFNNAGILTGGLIEEQNADEIETMFQVNLHAVVLLSRAVVPGMVRKGSGKIINNASVSAFMHFPCASTYAAAKAAVVAFTNCIDAELSNTGVSTLCLITPGVKTRMFDEIAQKYSPNIEVSADSIEPSEYALKIKSAIESDQRYLFPTGPTAVGLWIARFINPAFRSIVRRKLRRFEPTGP